MIDELLRNSRLIAILRKLPFAKIHQSGQALYDGGVRLFEVTMESENALQAIQTLSEWQVTVGAGTVLDAETARLAILHGAGFLVTPCLRADVIEMGRRYNVPVITGAFTPSEILAAFEMGSNYVKVFPAGALGPDYIKDVKGPLAHIPIVPSGGVTLDNAKRFIDSGALAVGVGSSLTDRKLIERDDFAAIERLARDYVRAVGQAS